MDEIESQSVIMFSALDTDYTVQVPTEMVPLKKRAKQKNYPDKGRLQEQRKVVPEVKEHLDCFTQSFPKNISASEVYKCMLPVWKNILADFFHNYNPSINSAEHCDLSCFKNNTTITLHANTHLYACWAHGYAHQCRCEFSTCVVQHTNKSDSLITCVLSGRGLGHILGDDTSYRNAGGNPKKQFDYYKSIQRLTGARNTTLNVEQSIEARIEKLTSAKKVDDEAVKHDDTAVPEGYLQLMNVMEEEKENQQANASPVKKKKRKSESIALMPPPKKIAKEKEAVFVARIATAADMSIEVLKKKREDLASKMRRQAFMYNSSAVTSLSKQAIEVGNKLMRAIVLEVLEDLLFDNRNRALYNQFMRKCTTKIAEKEIAALYNAACKKRVLMCNADILLILEHYNREFTEILPQVQRDTIQLEGFVTRILWLWRKCNESPFVRQQRVRKDRKTGVLNALPTAEDMCSLRQFALAMLYYLRDGLTVYVPNSYKKDALLLIAPEESLEFELPPSKDVCYFGYEAREELAHLISRLIFDEAKFNVNRVMEIEEQGKSKKGKRKKKTTKLLEPLGNSNKSLALIRSESIESSLMAMQNKNKRKSRSRSTLEDIASAGRSAAHSTCRVTSQTSFGAGEAVTEQQLIPFFMREPMLTGGSALTRRNVYSEDDVKRAKRFIITALDSYQHEIVNILD